MLPLVGVGLPQLHMQKMQLLPKSSIISHPSSFINKHIFSCHTRPAGFFAKAATDIPRATYTEDRCHKLNRRMSSGGPPAIDFVPPSSDDLAFWASFAAVFREKFGNMVRYHSLHGLPPLR